MRKLWIPAALVLSIYASPGVAATAPGADIENTATVAYTVGGNDVVQDTNTTTITVQELVDIDVVWQDSSEVPVGPGDTDQVLTFEVTNTGNGSETFTLSVDNSTTGDEFNPTLSTIYIETDGLPGLTAGDTEYQVNVNDPVLASEESVTVYVLNDIPGVGVGNGDTGDSELTATSKTITGVPGDVSAGDGDGGTNAIVGNSTGSDSDLGSYIIADISLLTEKSQVITDPFGGSEPVPGATITYTIEVSVEAGAGTAEGVTVTDPTPANTSFVSGSISLNGGGLSDQDDLDEGEFDDSADAIVNNSKGNIVVRLGDLVLADGVQTVQFSVTID